MPGFYLPTLKINDKLVTLADEEFHHMINVFRNKVGDSINLTNGKGLIAEAEIVELSRKKAFLEILKIEKKSISEPEIGVAFSLLKNKNDLMIIEKLTELGVKKFFPMKTDFTIKKYNDKTVAKYVKTAISAIKQCDNAFLPIFSEVLSFEKTIKKVVEEGYSPIVASERETNFILSDVLNGFKGDKICLFIGPEGGFSDKEFEYFDEKKVAKFKLGNHILRAETAAISSVSELVGIFLEKDKNYY